MVPRVPQPDVTRCATWRRQSSSGRSGWVAAAGPPSGRRPTSRQCCDCCSGGSASRRRTPGAAVVQSLEGMCPRCEGAGRIDDIDLDELVDWDRSPDDWPIKLADYAPGKWFWQIFTESGYVDLDKPLRDCTPKSGGRSSPARAPRSRRGRGRTRGSSTAAGPTCPRTTSCCSPTSGASSSASRPARRARPETARATARRCSTAGSSGATSPTAPGCRSPTFSRRGPARRDPGPAGSVRHRPGAAPHTLERTHLP